MQNEEVDCTPTSFLHSTLCLLPFLSELKPQQTGTGLLIRQGEVATTSGSTSLRPLQRGGRRLPRRSARHAGGRGVQTGGLRLGKPIWIAVKQPSPERSDEEGCRAEAPFAEAGVLENCGLRLGVPVS